MDNKRLIKLCLKGDAKAKNHLYQSYSKQMFSVCLRYAKTSQDAQDIFQEAFLLVYKNLKQIKSPEALSGWIKKIFVNTALAHNLKNGRLFIVENNDSYQVDFENQNTALSSLATDDLIELISSLPSGCRDVFNLYCVEGYSHKEIAEKLNVSVGTTKSQLFEARKILKVKISRLQRTRNIKSMIIK